MSERAVLKDEKFFDLILENVSSGVALIDDTGHFLLYNQTFLKLFGLSEESTIKNVNDQNWSAWQVINEKKEILHIDDHPVRKAALTGKRVNNQLVGVMLPSGGDLIWMLISAEPIYNEHGQHVETICTYQDITKYKLAEENLVINEDRLRLTLESTEIGTWDFDIDTGISVHSLRHDQIFGYHDLQPEWSYEISIRHMLPEYHQVGRNAVANAIKTGLLYYEAQIAWPDGSIHWIALKGRVMYSNDGKPIRMIGVVSEITERKLAEKARKENEERLSDLNATKDKFFSIIAHDLKSPFTSIIGFSDLLIDQIQKKDNDGIEEYARIIQKSSWNAMELLTNLFEWSRLQTGKMEFKPAQIDLATVIHEAIDHVSDSVWQKSIEIVKDFPDSLTILADKPMISTVLRNLLSNAIKFTNKGGIINVSVINRENELMVSVKDNGVGISQPDVEKIFRVDVSHSTSGTNGEEGTGLGLLLCKEFVLKHNGNIWVESEVGRGSVFVFTLPESPI